MSRAAVRYDARGRARLTFPYHPIFVAEIKGCVPSWARSYEPATKTWVVATPYDGPIIERMAAWWPDLLIRAGHPGSERREAPPLTPPVQAETPHATLHVLQSAPREVIDAAYRALVKLHHPDRLPTPARAGGNAALARINVAYERLTGGQR